MQFLQKFFTKPKTIQLTITSSNGFHLRPVAKFVSVAKTFSCKVTAIHKNRTVDAKGVNSLLSLSLEKGDTFTLTCKGKDAQDALDNLTDTFNTLMQNDKEMEVIEKEATHYESDFIEGDIIASGIAIAPLYHYKEEQIQKVSLFSFEEAVVKSINELETLYTAHKENSNAGIYLAQKELLASLKTESSTLLVLETHIENASAQLLGSKLEAKISDYKDILQRVKRHLGFEVETLFPNHSFILLADDLLPSQIEKLSRSSVAGVILKQTAINSHTAILLRGAGIVSLIKNASLKADQTDIIVDAHAGVIVSNPSQSDLKKAQSRFLQDQVQKDQAYAQRFDLATNKAGKTIKVLANVTDVNSANLAKEEGAEGIGLLRTEFLFKEEKPSFKMQVEAYEKIFDVFDDITLRTLDVGGDKKLPYIDLKKEDNPFLGIRGVRLFKTHPKVMEEQLHAIFTAVKNRPLKVMFPMVSTVQEFLEVKGFAEAIAKKAGLDISNIAFGIMIEVPSVLFLLEAFNKVVDFYSIGTNDLTQYLFAIERTHPTLKTDDLSPVVFSAIEMIAQKATKPVSICGELAGNEKAIPKLLEIGIETLSVSAKNIAQTKETIRHV